MSELSESNKQSQAGLSDVVPSARSGEVDRIVQNVSDARIASEAIGIYQILNMFG